MFRSFVVDEHSQIQKNIQKLEQQYHMTVPEAVSFVKKRYPQFSNFWNDFEPHLESSEACYKQRTFQEAEATPKMQSRMNIMLLVLSALLLLSTLGKHIGVSTETVPDFELVGDEPVLSRALVGQYQASTAEKLAELVTSVQLLEASKELEEESLKAQGPNPNLIPLREIATALKHAIKRLNKMRIVAQALKDKRTGPRENRKRNDRARNKAYVESQKKKDEARQMNEALVRIDKGNK